MLPPRLSVIMPSYNAERFIAESLESVVRQSVTDWELIVIDDASTDGTRDIVADYERRDLRIRLITEETNRGPAHARNLGIDQARGTMIAFIDSDDAWYSEKAAKQIAAMEQCQADVSYTGWERRREGDAKGVFVPVPQRVTYRTMLRRCKINCSTAMVRRSTCGTVRMPPLKLRQDHGYWLELLRDGRRTAVGINEPLIRCRMHDGSLSANKLIAARYSWKLLRDVERFGLSRSLWFFSGYAFEAVKLRLLLGTRRTVLTASQSLPLHGEAPELEPHSENTATVPHAPQQIHNQCAEIVDECPKLRTDRPSH